MVNFFHGRIEGTNIVVDNCNYNGDNCYYLISHPHTDHTGGLTAKFNKGAIHCSNLCKELLLMKFPAIQQRNPIIGHEIGSTFTLSHLGSPQRRGIKTRKSKLRNQKSSFESKESVESESNDIDSEDEWRDSESNGVQITLIDANHCPGSVMFLIKNNNGKIYLHTGDYRTNNQMINNKLLTNVWIDIVYMDVTFCHPQYKFPTKKEIASQFARYIKDKRKDKQWRKENNMSFKTIYIAARQFGVEPFVVEMCKLFNTKFWVDPKSSYYRHFNHFQSTKPYLTIDQSEAMFHIPRNFNYFIKQDKKQREENNLPKVMYVVPTTLYFAMRGLCNIPIHVDGAGIYHVLYSMHSDYFEMKKLISKLNVRQIMPFNDPFLRKERKPDNFDTIRWVRYQFRDCIEQNAKESKDIFIPSLNNSNSMDVDDKDCNQYQNKNIIQCQRTAQTNHAQNDKLSRILAKVRKNKEIENDASPSKSPPKRINTEPIPGKYNGMIGASHQDAFVNRMKKSNKNITEFNVKSPPKIRKSVSEMTYKDASISPMISLTTRKRKRSPRKHLVDSTKNKSHNNNKSTPNNRSAKRLRLSHKNLPNKTFTESSPKSRQGNNKNRDSQYIEATPMISPAHKKRRILYRAKSVDHMKYGLLNEENIGCLGGTPSEMSSTDSADLLGINGNSSSCSQSPILSNKKKFLTKKRVINKQLTLPIMASPSKSPLKESPSQTNSNSNLSENTFDAMDADVLSTKYTNSISPSRSLPSTQASPRPQTKNRDKMDHILENNNNNEENEDDDAKMMEIDDRDVTPGNDDIYIATPDNKENQSPLKQVDTTNIKQRFSVYKECDNGRKRPWFLAQWRVKERPVMIYNKSKWERDKLKRFLEIIDRLEMKRVYTIENAKYIVIDSKMMNNESIKDQVLYKLGMQFKNGCHNIREVYCYDIFEELLKHPGKRGVWFGEEFERYLMASTFEITTEYLMEKGLWPIKPKNNKNLTQRVAVSTQLYQ